MGAIPPRALPRADQRDPSARRTSPPESTLLGRPPGLTALRHPLPELQLRIERSLPNALASLRGGRRVFLIEPFCVEAEETEILEGSRSMKGDFGDYLRLELETGGARGT